MSLSDFNYKKTADGYIITGLKEYRCEVVIPEGVTEIGEDAFITRGMEAVIMPSTLKRIANNAFFECTGLSFVDFSKCRNLTHIGAYAFSECWALSEIVLPSSLKSLDDGAFDCSSALTEINLPCGIEEMGQEIFLGCDRLKKITVEGDKIPKSWPKNWNGSDAKILFKEPRAASIGAASAKKVSTNSAPKVNTNSAPRSNAVSAKNNRAANDQDPYDNLSPQELKWHLDNLDRVGDRIASLANKMRTSLEQDNLTNTAAQAKSTVSVTQPKSTVSVAQPKSTVSAPQPKSTVSATPTASRTISYTRNSYYTPLDDFEIRKTADGLELGCAKKTLAIRELILPPEITSIADHAFYWGTFLPNLTKFKAGSTLKRIGTDAFLHSRWLREIDIPTTVEIGDSAFSYCESLINAVITPKMGKQVYYNSGVRSVSMPDAYNPITVIREGTFYGTKIKSIRIPSSVTRIEDIAFSGCDELVSVEFENPPYISFGKRAFSGCKSLRTFRFPDNYRGDLPESLFAGCRVLTDLKFAPVSACIGLHSLINIGLQDMVIPRHITPTKNSIGGQWLRKIIFEGRTVNEVKSLLDNGFIMEGYRVQGHTTELVCTDGVLTYRERVWPKSYKNSW